MLVIGGGISGILTLRALIRAGFNARAIVSPEIGGEQTIACQRYLHAGSFYEDPELIQLLGRCRVPWLALAAETGLRIISGRSYVGFPSEVDAESRLAIWRANGLRHHPASLPNGHPFVSGGLRRVFRMADEGWIADRNPSRVLATGIESQVTAGRVIRVEGQAGQFHVFVGTERRAEVMTADAIVLAAGAGNRQLVADLANVGAPRQQLRRCQVLELVGPLPNLSLLCPSSGHFIVPAYASTGQTVWRCTFDTDHEVDSSDPSIDPARYMRQRQALADALPCTAAPGVKAALTSVAKAESWDLGRGSRPGSYFVGQVMPGAIVIWPTKLTLAPLAAEQAVALIKGL